jgi:hypothetical protein
MNKVAGAISLNVLPSMAHYERLSHLLMPVLLLLLQLQLQLLQVHYTKALHFVNRVANAIHRAVPGATVTAGAHSMHVLLLLPLQVPYTNALRFINRVAGAIHRAVPGAKVTVGAHSMPYSTDIPMPQLWYDNAPMNYYSDDLLVRYSFVLTLEP